MGYYHYDGQGNVVSVTDAAREEITFYEYDAWGNVLTACGSLANEFRFSTKQASLSTGLTDFGFRWYDPTTGRWTQRDPIGLAGGVNLYGYVGGNPANFGDSSGLEWSPFGYDFTTGALPSRAAGSMNLASNDVADGIAVVNAFINGGVEAVLDDPALQMLGGFCQVAIGGAATWCGLPELGLPVMGYGASNIADAISRMSGNGSYNPARDLTAGLFEMFFGMSPEDAQVAAGITETALTLAAGAYADYALAQPWGRAGNTTSTGGTGNVGGRLGGPAHRAKVGQVADQLKGGGYRIIAGGGNPEARVSIPGEGRYRYPDVWARKGGTDVFVQVGNLNKRTGLPVAREAGALRDLRTVPNSRTYFVGY